jgi:hypothetical protein
MPAMQEDNRSAKLQLFVCDGNQLWRSLDNMDQAAKRADSNWVRLPRHKLLGIAPETLSQWRRREVVASQKNVERALQMLRAHVEACTRIPDWPVEVAARDLLDRIDDFARCLDTASDDVYAAGRALGMSADLTRQAIDIEIHGQKPLLGLAYYDIEKQAKAICQEHAGLYHALIRRTGCWLQGTLEVRYVVALPGGHIVRTKLNVPNVNRQTVDSSADGADGVFEYDGFVRDLPPMLYWSFEKRKVPLQDFFHFITIGRPVLVDGLPVLHGSYLTVDQSDGTHVLHDRILLRGVPGLCGKDNDPPQRRRTAFDGVRVLRSADPGFDAAERLLRRFR